MTVKSLAVLGLATVVAVGIAVATSFSWNTRDAVSQRGAPVLPALAKKVDDIGLITVETSEHTTTIKRDGDGFTDAASGYPIKREPVRALVASAALLAIEENKTGDATRHGELDLNAPDAKRGAGEKIIFRTKDSNELAALIAGKADYSVGGISGGQYVRRAGDDQAYLVRGSVKLPFGRAGWFDTKLLELEPETMASATIAKGEIARVSLTKVGDKLKLVDLPEGKAEDPDKIARVTRLFSALSFADVRKKKGAPPADAQSVSMTTGDGLTIKLVSIAPSEDKGLWVQISATADKPEAEKALAEVLKKLDGYEFKLASATISPFDWSAADLTKEPQS